MFFWIKCIGIGNIETWVKSSEIAAVKYHPDGSEIITRGGAAIVTNKKPEELVEEIFLVENRGHR